MNPVVSHDLVKDFTSNVAAHSLTVRSTRRSSALNILPKTDLLSAACSNTITAMATVS
jgi:hypothetical protein